MKHLSIDYQAAYCYGIEKESVIACDHYREENCPLTCKFARKMEQHRKEAALDDLTNKFDDYKATWRKYERRRR